MIDTSSPSTLIGSHAFYRELRAQQNQADAKHAQAVGKTHIPSSIKVEEASAYWNFLTVGRNLDVRL